MCIAAVVAMQVLCCFLWIDRERTNRNRASPRLLIARRVLHVFVAVVDKFCDLLAVFICHLGTKIALLGITRGVSQYPNIFKFMGQNFSWIKVMIRSCFQSSPEKRVHLPYFLGKTTSERLSPTSVEEKHGGFAFQLGATLPLVENKLIGGGDTQGKKLVFEWVIN